MCDYKQRIRGNIQNIQSIQEDTYPSLHHLLIQRNSALQGRLLAILQRMIDVENQEEDRDGNQWYFESIRHFIESCHDEGKTPKTWYKSIILLCSLGLIWRRKPTEDATTPYQRSAYSRRRTDINKHWQAICFYSAPEYTSEILIQAEQRARKWIQRGATIKGLSKESIIEVFGQRVANMIYQDERRKTKLHKQLEKTIVSQAKAQIKARKYTTVKGILRGTVEATFHSFESEIGESTILVPEEEARRKAWLEVNRVFDNRGRTLLESSNLVYRRPTNEEKERYNLEGNGWIISKMVTNS